jgi:hypothetical protein
VLLNSTAADGWLSQLLLEMRSTFFLAGSTIASHKETADKLMIIVSGRSEPLLILEVSGYCFASWVQSGSRTHRVLTIRPRDSMYRFTKRAPRFNQAVFTHIMKAPAPSLSKGGWGLIYSPRCCKWYQIEHSVA